MGLRLYKDPEPTDPEPSSSGHPVPPANSPVSTRHSPEPGRGDDGDDALPDAPPPPPPDIDTSHLEETQRMQFSLIGRIDSFVQGIRSRAEPLFWGDPEEVARIRRLQHGGEGYVPVPTIAAGDRLPRVYPREVRVRAIRRAAPPGSAGGEQRGNSEHVHENGHEHGHVVEGSQRTPPGVRQFR